MNADNPTTFDWSASAGANYDFDLATDAGFSNIIESQTGLTSNQHTSMLLNTETAYFWRVRPVNGCGIGSYASASFTTGTCFTIYSDNIPVNIPASSTGTVTSTINITNSGTLNDVNIIDLEGTHTYIEDLKISIESPAGTTVLLYDQSCGSNDDFDLNYDDAAATATIPCPPTTGMTYQPVGNLSNFNGEDINGTWTLSVEDVFAQDGGALERWALNICLDPACNFPDAPTVTGNNSVCPGGSVTLSVGSANLGDATEWEWYSGACGGVIVGTEVLVSQFHLLQQQFIM